VACLKLLLTLVALCIVIGSFYADYRWKRWIAAKREEREGDQLNR
jgi:hypothetical protein